MAIQRIVVLGGEGVGIIAASIIEMTRGMELIGFLNDGLSVGETQGTFRKFPVVGASQDVHRFIRDEDAFVFLAYKTMKKEKEMWENLLALDVPRERFVNLIHPHANVPWGYCQIGNGVLMAAGAQLSPDTVIGDNCILLGNVLIGHDTTLERYVTVANHASVGAQVHVGNAAHIGSNATIRQWVDVGDYALVGMGSVVLQDVAPNTIVAGVPARVIEVK